MSFRVGSRFMVTGLLASAMALVACGPEHPAYIEDNPTSEPVPSEGGQDGDGSTTPSGGKSGSGSGQGDAGAADVGPGGPGNVDIGLFDPDEIYIYGTLSEGAGYLDAVCNIRDPNTYLVGFTGSTDGNSLTISNGSMLYDLIGEQGIRAFAPEFQSSLKVMDLDYPEDPLRDDPIQVTAPCLAEDDGTLQFLASPDGRFIYQCPDEVWYEDGEAVYDASEDFGNVLAFGYDGLTLLDDVDLAVMNVADGQKHTIDGLESLVNIMALRATPDGFHIVIPSKTGNDTPELWNISADAVAERLDIYPLPPEGRNAHSWGKLTPSDALYQMGSGPETFQDIVVMRSLDGTSEVVYDEADEPRVKLHISYLFTGP